MKTILKSILLIAVIVILTVVYFTNPKEPAWKTYTNTIHGFSFDYPPQWGEPHVAEDLENDGYQISFKDYSFSVNNGFYFNQINNERPSVEQMVQSYKDDMEAKNEIKSLDTKDIKVDNHPAVKVTATTLDGTEKIHKDIYIYQSKPSETKFILITTTDAFAPDATLDRLLSTFKFI